MIDVRSRRCAAAGCKRQPSYGFEGSRRACFCAAHKTEGMVDVVSRRCEQPNCLRRPLYGYEGQKSQYCSSHKKPGQVDVCNRRCQETGCSKRPCFGLPGERPSFCGSHRTSAMVDVISHKCSYPGCSHPTGYEAKRVRSSFCDKHKSVGQAGASLLQLAGGCDASGSTTLGGEDIKSPPRATAKASSSSTDDKASWRKPALSKEGEGSEVERSGVFLVGNAEEEGHRRQGFAADAPIQRRASYAGSSTLPQKLASPAREKLEPSPKRRCSVPTVLPSVGSLLERVPRTHLKRPREETTPASYDAAIPSGPLSVSAPDAPGSAAETATDKGIEDAIGEAKEVVDEAGVQQPQARAKGGSLPPKCSSPTVPSSAGAKRLFPGRQPQKDRVVWDSGWQGKAGTGVGVITSRIMPDWRKVGLGAVGRAASFDETRMATDRQNMRVENAGQPRRASAFVNEVSTLTPIRTEMGRRVSAYEPRHMSQPQPGGHYSDLLSAKKGFSGVSGNAPPRHPSACWLRNPDAAIAEVGGNGGSEISTANSLFSGCSTPTRWPSPRGPRPKLVRRGSGLTAGLNSTTSLFHVMPAHAAFSASLQHERCDETASLSSTTSTRAGDYAGSGEGEALESRRWPVSESAYAPAASEPTELVPAWGAPMDEETNSELPICEQTAMEVTSGDGGPGRRSSLVTGAGAERPLRPAMRRGATMIVPPVEGSGTEDRAGSDVSQGQGRRWSFPEQSLTPPDQVATGSAGLAPAWGATAGEIADVQSTSVAKPGSDVTIGGRESRRKGLFMGGASADVPGDGIDTPVSSTSGAKPGQDVIAGSRGSRRKGLFMSSAVTDVLGDGRSISASSDTGLNTLTYQGSTSNTFVPAWGAAVEEATQQGWGSQDDKPMITPVSGMGGLRNSSVFGGGSEKTGDQASPTRLSQRRGSLVVSSPEQKPHGPGMLSPTPKITSRLFERRLMPTAPPSPQETGVSAHSPLRAMAPPPSRRTSCLMSPEAPAAEPASVESMPPLPTEQRRRRSIVGAGTGECVTPGELRSDRGRMPTPTECAEETQPRQQQPAVHAEYSAAWVGLKENVADCRDEASGEIQGGKGWGTRGEA
ncbi:unnamed protein product [Sphacelaria rigidula]